MKNFFVLLFIVSVTNLIGQDRSVESFAMDDPFLQKRANEIAHKYIITDGHVDLPYRLKIRNFKLEREYLGIPLESKTGDFDYIRAKKGGLDAPFMSIYLPSNYQEEPGSSKKLADSLIAMVEGIASAHPDKFAIAKSPEDCERQFAKGMISLPMGMENGSGIEDQLSNLGYFKNKGISYITLTHAKDNLICDSSYDTTGTWGGLSPFGKEVVAEMNRVGIMVDISHVSDNTFYQVIKMTRVPVIASHSSCRRFTPGFERNMDDDMIRSLGKNGGVIQINFGSSFLDKTVADNIEKMRGKLADYLKERGVGASDPGAVEIIEQFQKENPVILSDVYKVADHIDHVVKLAGIDHVAIGSDFDGVGDTLPTGLKDVSQYPNLIYVLLKRGYGEEEIAKILFKNVFRVWQQVIDYAASNG